MRLVAVLTVALGTSCATGQYNRSPSNHPTTVKKELKPPSAPVAQRPTSNTGWFEGALKLQGALARGVYRTIQSPLSHHDYVTGAELFDREWHFATYMMAGMGFGQIGLEHPTWRNRSAQRMAYCIQQLLRPELRLFDKRRWQADPLTSLASDRGHVAYLGYLNLLLSFHRLVEPQTPYEELNDKVSTALIRRFSKSSTGLLETYPNEVYPVDNAAGIASVALRLRTKPNVKTAAFVQRWLAKFRHSTVEPNTGLLYQRVTAKTAHPIGPPRGSGTALAAYFLSFAAPRQSRELYDALVRELKGSLWGYSAVREYARNVVNGQADIDSGPIIFGYGMAATGFAISLARIHRDRDTYTGLVRTAYAFGRPRRNEDTMTFKTGGPVHDAIMLAMLTAQPAHSNAVSARK